MNMQDYRDAADRIEISPHMRQEVLKMKAETKKKISVTRFAGAAAAVMLALGIGGSMGYVMYRAARPENSAAAPEAQENCYDAPLVQDENELEAAELFQRFYMMLSKQETDFTFPGMVIPLDYTVEREPGGPSFTVKAALYDGYQLGFCLETEDDEMQLELTEHRFRVSDLVPVQQIGLHDTDGVYRIWQFYANSAFRPLQQSQLSVCGMVLSDKFRYLPPVPQKQESPVMLEADGEEIGYTHIAVTPLAAYLFGSDPDVTEASAERKAYITTTYASLPFAVEAVSAEEPDTVTPLGVSFFGAKPAGGDEKTDTPDAGIEMLPSDRLQALSFDLPLDPGKTAALRIAGREIPVPPMTFRDTVETQTADTRESEETAEPDGVQLLRAYYTEISGAPCTFDFAGYALGCDETFTAGREQFRLRTVFYDGVKMRYIYDVLQRDETAENPPVLVPEDHGEFIFEIYPLPETDPDIQSRWYGVVYHADGSPVLPSEIRLGINGEVEEGAAQQWPSEDGASFLTYSAPDNAAPLLEVAGMEFRAVTLTPAGMVLKSNEAPSRERLEALKEAMLNAEVSVFMQDGTEVLLPLNLMRDDETTPGETCSYRGTEDGIIADLVFQQPVNASDVAVIRINDAVLDLQSDGAALTEDPDAALGEEATEPENTSVQMLADMPEEARSREFSCGTVRVDGLHSKGDTVYLDFSFTPNAEFAEKDIDSVTCSLLAVVTAQQGADGVPENLPERSEFSGELPVSNKREADGAYHFTHKLCGANKEASGLLLHVNVILDALQLQFTDGSPACDAFSSLPSSGESLHICTFREQIPGTNGETFVPVWNDRTTPG